MKYFPCSIPACPSLAVTRGRCREHQAEADRVDNARKRKRRDGFYDSAAWKIQRRIVLARDIVCRLCGEQPSTEVDHVQSIESGGSKLSLDNLQGACSACHSRKTRDEQLGRI